MDAIGLTSLIAVVVSIGLLTVIVFRGPSGPFSPSAVFATVLFVFHFGLIAALAMPFSLSFDADRVLRTWLRSPSLATTAISAAMIGIVGLTLGILIGHRNSRRRWTRTPLHRWSVAPDRLAAIGATFAFISVGFVGLRLADVGGVGAFTGSYATYLSIESRDVLGLGLLGVGLATVFLAATPWTKWHRVGVPVLAMFAILGFPLGLRGEVLFPAAIAAMLVARRRAIAVSPKILAIAFATFLFVLAAATAGSVVRQTGVDSVAIGDVPIGPEESLAELGSTLRAVVETVSWHEQGDSYALGATYWAPLDRAARRVLGNSTPVATDDRVMNVVVMKRVGPIGYSSIAEAYRNFGLWGVFLVHLLLGLTLGWTDTWRPDPFRLALTGVILLPLLNHVRNSFTPVPLQVTVGVVILLFAAHRARTAFPTTSRAHTTG